MFQNRKSFRVSTFGTVQRRLSRKTDRNLVALSEAFDIAPAILDHRSRQLISHVRAQFRDKMFQNVRFETYIAPGPSAGNQGVEIIPSIDDVFPLTVLNNVEPRSHAAVAGFKRGDVLDVHSVVVEGWGNDGLPYKPKCVLFARVVNSRYGDELALFRYSRYL